MSATIQVAVDSHEIVRNSLNSKTNDLHNDLPWSDINLTGKFLSPRRLDPIFMCLTAFNCNKIYTIGKPNVFRIC